jgi:hypothetical protein
VATVAALVDDARSNGAAAYPPREADVHARANGLGYDFAGPTRFDKLLTGIAVASRSETRLRGGALDDFVNRDALEDDYGRLLDRAYECSMKVLASPVPASWNQVAEWLRLLDRLRRAA